MLGIEFLRLLASVQRTRFWAMMRSPAFSIMALMPPVRLRAVASGLMMENVRSIAIPLVSLMDDFSMDCGGL